jgi:hypothetical protein
MAWRRRCYRDMEEVAVTSFVGEEGTVGSTCIRGTYFSKTDPDVQVPRSQTVLHAHALILKEDILSRSSGVVVKVDMTTGA